MIGSGFDTADERLDLLVNLDIGQRGIEPLYHANREITGRSPVGSAAEALLSIPEGGTVLLSTGSVSRAWISPGVGENDGPSGAAAIARALALARRAVIVCAVEETLLAPVSAVMQAAGLSVVSHGEAQAASLEGSLATVVMCAYPVDDDNGKRAACQWLNNYSPDLMFSTERIGRNRNGIYYNMRGRDCGAGRARVDHLFDEALRAGIPVVAVGDGGNEIGMGKIAEAVAEHVPHGADGDCPCGGGIGAVTGADVLVTAGVSNWGCTAVAAAMAARTGDIRLLHTPDSERRLLEIMTAQGLINSTHGVVDPNVDGIDKNVHISIAELARAIVAGIL